MWPGIIKYTRNWVGHVARYNQFRKDYSWSCSLASLNIQEIELIMWPGIIKYTRTRVGQVARYN